MKKLLHYLSWETVLGVGGTVLITLAITLFAHAPADFAAQQEQWRLSQGLRPMPAPPPPGRLGAEKVPQAPLVAARFSLGGGGRDATLMQLANDRGVVAKGAEYYQMFCLSCHGLGNVGGDSPSNLFDDIWYRGATPAEIELTVLDGYLPTGMPAWRGMLPDDTLAAITAYMLSFQ
jgi:mono/diheme cytochrome c family protein